MQAIEAVEDTERWYREHYALVWDTARRYGIPADAREDVVQDTFLAAYRRRPTISGTSMRAWLYGIARRVAANHRRTAFRRRRKQDRLAMELAARSLRIPESALAAATLEAFLADLEPADRELFVLSEIEGFTGPEIARALGCNLATTYSRIRTVRQRFARQCAEPTDAIEEHRGARPRATAAGWAALVPQLQGSGVATATTWLGPNLKGLLIGVAAGAVVVGGVGVLTDPPPEAATVAAVTAQRRDEDPTPPVQAATPVAAAMPAPAPEPEPAVEPPPETEPPPTPTHAPRRVAPEEAKPNAATTELVPDTETGKLLREAMQALHQDNPRRAMTLVERHEAEFPGSALSDVRAVIRVKALCGLGRTAAAEAVAGGYVATHPASAMKKQLRRGCAEKKSAATP